MSRAEKTCGPCQACCVALKIDTPEFRKKAQTPCPHLVQKGCGIYDNRPPVCRSFLCGWRQMPELDASWRPDLSGVMLLELPEHQLPKAYRAAGPGWVFVVSDGEKAITPRLGKFIAGLVERRIAVFLSAMTPRIQINEQLEPLVAAGDLAGVIGVLRRTHALLLPASAGTRDWPHLGTLSCASGPDARHRGTTASMKTRATSRPAKTCGECRACCIELKIDTPEFKKQERIPCSHLTGSGCGIYHTRYKICHEFLCGWLQFPELGDAMRPDRSGVIVLQRAQDQLPPAYQAAGNGIHLFIPGGETAIKTPGFAQYVADLVSRGVAVYLDVATPAALVNEHIRPMVAARDFPAIVRTLTYMHRLQLGAWHKTGLLGMLPNLYRFHLEKMRARVKTGNK